MTTPALALDKLAVTIDGRTIVQATSLGVEDMVITDLIARHGLPINASPVMRGHDEYDKVFADIRAKLHAKPGETVNLDHVL